MRRAAAAWLSLGIAACGDAGGLRCDAGKAPAPVRLEDVRVESVAASTEIPTQAKGADPCSPALVVEWTPVRREPMALLRHGGYLYWVDGGHFEEKPELRWVSDGAVWRMPVSGGAPETIAEGLGVVTDMARMGDTLVIGQNEGLATVSLEGSNPRPRGASEGVKHLDADGSTLWMVTNSDPEALHSGQDPDALKLSISNVGYVQTLETTDERVVIGGLDSGNARQDATVTILEAGLVRRRVRLPGPRITSLAMDGDDVLAGTLDRLWRIAPKPAEPTTERAPGGEIDGVVVDGGIVFTLIGFSGPRYAVHASGPGQAATELAAGEGAAWRLTVDATHVYFVQSAPVEDPWTKERTPFRIGKVARGCG